MQALLVFTYLAFFFSLSATFSSLLLTDELGEVQVRASQRESWLGPPEDLVIHEDPSKLLNHFGARKTWRPVMWHCTSLDTLVSVAVDLKGWNFCRVFDAHVGIPLFDWANARIRMGYGDLGNCNRHVLHCIDMLAPAPIDSSIPVVQAGLIEPDSLWGGTT